MNIYNKLLGIIVSFSLAIGFATPANTQELSLTEEELNFINYVTSKEGIDSESEDVEITKTEDGVINVIRHISDDELIIYSNETSSMGPQNQELITIDSEIQPNGVISVIWGAISIYYNIKKACTIIKDISGYDMCGTFINNLSTGTYEVTRTLHTEPCPYPPHSYSCTIAPYRYWTTTVKKVTSCIVREGYVLCPS